MFNLKNNQINANKNELIFFAPKWQKSQTLFVFFTLEEGVIN